MTNSFNKNDIQKFINVLGYPVIIVNNDDFPVYKNDKFNSLEKIKDNEIQDKIISSQIHNEYMSTVNKKQLYFTLNKSSISIDNSEFTIVSFFNISIRKELVKKIESKENLFNQLTEQLPQSIVLFSDKIIYVNKTFEKLLGLSEKLLINKSFMELLDFQDQDIFKDVLEKLSLSKKTQIETSLKIKKKSEETIWIKLIIKRIKDNEKYLFLAVISDISKEVKKYDELSRLAYYDKLTGIYNRRKLDELLLMEHKITKRYDRTMSALFFDIDHFKKVNDTYGHDIGDSVLSNLAMLISKEIRETDIFARWGGEEFIILLPETTNENAMLLAQEIMDSLAMYTFEQVGHITISIGISSIKGKERLSTFTKRLDDALYKAKKDGRNRYIVLQ